MLIYATCRYRAIAATDIRCLSRQAPYVGSRYLLWHHCHPPTHRRTNLPSHDQATDPMVRRVLTIQAGYSPCMAWDSPFFMAYGTPTDAPIRPGQCQPVNVSELNKTSHRATTNMQVNGQHSTVGGRSTYWEVGAHIGVGPSGA